MNWLQVFSGLVTGTGLIGCIFFTTAYHIRSRGAWRRSEVGWFFMTFWATLAGLFLFVLSSQVFGPNSLFRQIVSLVLYVGLVAQTWWPARLLWKATKND